MRTPMIIAAAITAALLSTAHADPSPTSTLPTENPQQMDQNKKATPGTGQQNPEKGRTGTQSDAKFDINNADEAMLMKELDLNKKDAQSVVNHRKTVGKFKSVSDLKAVPGLKPDVIERISAMVKYDESAAGSPAVAPVDRGTYPESGVKRAD